MPKPERAVLVDSHCHLDFPDFANDLAAVIGRARQAGVRCTVTIATQPHLEPASRQIAQTYPDVFYAAGVHPLHAHQHPLTTVAALSNSAQHPKMVAIGETGLDFFRTRAFARQQADSFAVHLQAAQALRLPVIVHARAADDEIAAMLTAACRQAPLTGVMHCFAGGAALAQQALALGFYLSASAIVTFNNSDALRAVFAAAPLDRLLIETDAPYLAPAPYRGKRNEPAYVARTAQAVAALRGISVDALAQATTANFYRLFSKIPHPDTATPPPPSCQSAPCR